MPREPRGYLHSEADVSEDGVYRYSLARRLSMGERAVLFVGLNPSTADALQDDPTIRRCVGYARLWGFDWLYMGNLCAFRATDPAAMLRADDPVGPRNQEALTWMAQKADLVIAAWGATKVNSYARTLAKRIEGLPHTHYLKLNSDGSPAHPLYLSKRLVPESYRTGLALEIR